jgi:hypothetical protein
MQAKLEINRREEHEKFTSKIEEMMIVKQKIDPGEIANYEEVGGNQTPGQD